MSKLVKAYIPGLVGMSVTNIDIDREKNEIMIHTECGRVFMLYHDQNCCESVKIINHNKLHEIRGKLKDIDVYTLEEKRRHERKLTTKITFITTDRTEVVEWFGEDEGYYSLEVDFAEVFSDLQFLKRPSKWPGANDGEAVCKLKRKDLIVTEKSSYMYGFIIHNPHSSTIIVNLGDMCSNRADETLIYNTVEEIVADGWMVSTI